MLTCYNIYLATLVVRIDKRKKLFLYDVVNVKKKAVLDLHFRQKKIRSE